MAYVTRSTPQTASGTIPWMDRGRVGNTARGTSQLLALTNDQVSGLFYHCEWGPLQIVPMWVEPNRTPLVTTV